MLTSKTLQASCRPANCKQVAPVARAHRISRIACRVSSISVETEQQPARVASVSVNLGNAIEQINVKLTAPNSKLIQAEMQFPLGLVLENVDDRVVVTEVSEGSAAKLAGVRVGDVVCATSAMTMQMVYPTMNIMFGGVGRPALVKILLPTSKAPFAKVMDAVRSNSPTQGGDGSIILVLEREMPYEVSNKGHGSVRERVGAAVSAAGASALRSKDGGALFDPRIFESLE